MAHPRSPTYGSSPPPPPPPLGDQRFESKFSSCSRTNLAEASKNCVSCCPCVSGDQCLQQNKPIRARFSMEAKEKVDFYLFVAVIYCLEKFGYDWIRLIIKASVMSQQPCFVLEYGQRQREEPCLMLGP